MREIDYLTLAKAASAQGNRKLVLMYFRNNARVRRKVWTKEKIAALTATH